MDVTRLLDRDGSTDAALVGGKAASLAQLARAGLPVPAFVTLTTAGAAEALGGALPDALVRAVATAAATLDAPHGFAVRSSAVGEDGAVASHAGLFTTVLAVSTAVLPDAIVRVATSRQGRDLPRYREHRGLAMEAPAVAVVVQALVDARVSGVAFTADPVTGAPATIIVAGLGLGEGVVGDRIACDTYRRPLGSLTWEIHVAPKRHRLVPRRNGSRGTYMEDVPDLESARPALSPTELETIAGLLGRIEETRDAPVDVEWAMDHAGRLWIVQVRPATALPEPPTEVWDDSNVGESYPGLTRPLTFSLARRVYEQLFTRALREAGVRSSEITALTRHLSRLVGLIRGRLYFNLTNYYPLFGCVPGLEAAVEPWRAALGVTDTTGPAPARRRVLGVFRTWVRLWCRYLRNDRDVARCLDTTDRIVAEWRRRALESATPERLLEQFHALCEALLPNWTAIIYNDLFLFLAKARLERTLGGDRLLVQRTLGRVGGSEVASVAAARSLRMLADAALTLPGARDLLRSARSDREVCETLTSMSEAGPLREAAAAYLDRHGDRTLGELNLDTETPAEAPWALVPLWRSAAEGLPLPDLRPGERAPLPAPPGGGPIARVVARLLLTRCRKLIAHRENLSHARARAYGILRRLFRALGSALARQGAIPSPSDIHYVTLEELEACVADAPLSGELGRLADARRIMYARWAGQPAPPHRITIGRGPAHEAPGPGASSMGRADLCGTPCSSGVARGRVRVLSAPTGAEQVRGAIIVASVADPGWLPLMLQARGLILERGTVLSHCAIIGRELGLPTIVGVEHATTRLRDGDEVEMDGRSGRVRICRDDPVME